MSGRVWRFLIVWLAAMVAVPVRATPTPTRTPTPINIGNFVWDDLDGDGRQDAGEPGLEGVTVQLWNSSKTTLIATDVTDVNGLYTVVAPVPGNYRVRVVLPSISDQFSVKDSAAAGDNADSDINPSGTSFGFTDIIAIADNVISITRIDAGIIKFRTPTPTRTPTPINIGNFVWDDLDGDGRQDPGEPGLEGVTVQLWNSAKSVLISTDVTDANGLYTVVAPTPGNYRVRVVLPAINDQFSPKDNAAAGDNADSDINPSGTSSGFTDIIAIAANVISISNIDAGIIKFRTPTPTRTPTPINVGNFVWHDLDGDGEQDPGEPGLFGVRVQLWNSTKTVMYGETTTNASGLYVLVAPTPGSYRVRVLLPNPGDQFSPKDVLAAGDNKDSDITNTLLIPANFGYTSVYTFNSNLISIVSIDAGIVTDNPPSTPSTTPSRTITDTPPPGTPPHTPTPTPTYDPAEPTWTATATVTDTPSATATGTDSPTTTPLPPPAPGLPCGPGDNCADGEPCSDGNQCASGFCTDGVCCNEACDAAGASCNQARFVGVCLAPSGAPALSPVGLALGLMLLAGLAALRLSRRRDDQA